jgi:hypothetical protein
MSIILTIRKFLKLDRVEVSFDQELNDSVGLLIPELKLPPPNRGCLVHNHDSLIKDLSFIRQSVQDFHS